MRAAVSSVPATGQSLSPLAWSCLHVPVAWLSNERCRHRVSPLLAVYGNLSLIVEELLKTFGCTDGTMQWTMHTWSFSADWTCLQLQHTAACITVITLSYVGLMRNLHVRTLIRMPLSRCSGCSRDTPDSALTELLPVTSHIALDLATRLTMT